MLGPCQTAGLHNRVWNLASSSFIDWLNLKVEKKKMKQIEKSFLKQLSYQGYFADLWKKRRKDGWTLVIL